MEAKAQVGRKQVLHPKKKKPVQNSKKISKPDETKEKELAKQKIEEALNEVLCGPISNLKTESVLDYLQYCSESLSNESLKYPTFYCLKCLCDVGPDLIKHFKVEPHFQTVGRLCRLCNVFLVTEKEKGFLAHLAEQKHAVLANKRSEEMQRDTQQNADPLEGQARNWPKQRGPSKFDVREIQRDQDRPMQFDHFNFGVPLPPSADLYDNIVSFAIHGLGRRLNINFVYNMFVNTAQIVLISICPGTLEAQITLQPYYDAVTVADPLLADSLERLTVPVLRGKTGWITWKHDQITRNCVKIFQLKSIWDKHFTKVAKACEMTLLAFEGIQSSLIYDLLIPIQKINKKASVHLFGAQAIGLSPTLEKAQINAYLDGVPNFEEDLYKCNWRGRFSFMDSNRCLLHNASGITCYLTNDYFGYQAANLLKFYSNMDSRVRYLLVSIREWWKMNTLVEGFELYCGYLMCDWLVIFFLMQRHIKLLPNAQVVKAALKENGNPSTLPDASECKLDKPKLLAFFFHYYNHHPLTGFVMDLMNGTMTRNGHSNGLFIINPYCGEYNLVDGADPLSYQKQISATFNHMISMPCEFCPEH